MKKQRKNPLVIDIHGKAFVDMNTVRFIIDSLKEYNTLPPKKLPYTPMKGMKEERIPANSDVDIYLDALWDAIQTTKRHSDELDYKKLKRGIKEDLDKVIEKPKTYTREEAAMLVSDLLSEGKPNVNNRAFEILDSQLKLMGIRLTEI